MKHEVKFDSSGLNCEEYIEIYNGIYKCGCGIIFKVHNPHLKENIKCPDCTSQDVVIRALSELSKYATKTGSEKELKSVLWILTENLQDFDLYSEEEFPDFHKVLKVVCPKEFE